MHYWQAQKHPCARWILNKQSALPRRPLRGRTLLRAPSPCGTVEKQLRVRVQGKINPQKISRRLASHPSEQPSSATTRPFLAPLPLHLPKKSSLPPPPPPRCRLARFSLPTPRVPAAHSQATPHSARKVFVYLPHRPLWTAITSS
jgi:hypothetical protein